MSHQYSKSIIAITMSYDGLQSDESKGINSGFLEGFTTHNFNSSGLGPEKLPKGLTLTVCSTSNELSNNKVSSNLKPGVLRTDHPEETQFVVTFSFVIS